MFNPKNLRRKIAIATISFFLLLTLFSASLVSAETTSPTLIVYSPINGAVCKSNNITVTGLMTPGKPDAELQDLKQIYHGDYQVDGQAHKGIMDYGNFSVTLEISNGIHILKIRASDVYLYKDKNAPFTGPYYESVVSLNITVDTAKAPNISIDNLNIQENNSTFSITTDFNDCKIAYNLDNTENVTVPNILLSERVFSSDNVDYSYEIELKNLTSGQHHLKAYVTDNLGYIRMAEQTFTIGNQQLESSPSTPILTIALTSTIIAVTLIGTILLIYNRHKGTNKKKIKKT